LTELPQPGRGNLSSDYVAARRFVTEQISGWIAATEPDLTDHSEKHLIDVMSRARSLIGDKQTYFDPNELYLLAVSVLFHDVGNLHGRQKHNKKIASIYAACRKQEARFNTERNAILAIAGAHTGSAKDGSKDTLSDLGRLSFQANTVRAHELAAVLRFADELAEGPQRTSAYLLNKGIYKAGSQIFHEYSSVSEYCIERSAGRIASTFSMDIELDPSSDVLRLRQGSPLEDLLKLCYLRIVKVDQERRYCKHYSDLLSVFKETSACFIFYHREQPLELNLAGC
jgi:hypothetical protein